MNTSTVTFYKEPAPAYTHAMPLGCGSRGAMVQGRYDIEKINLNHDTFWAGLPIKNDYKQAGMYINHVRSLIDNGELDTANKFVEKMMLGDRIEPYLPLGEIEIEFGHTDVTDYVRALDLEKAMYTVDYVCHNAKYHREGFVSHPHKTFVQKFTCDKKQLSFNISLTSEMKAETFVDQGYVKMCGSAPIHDDWAKDDIDFTTIIYDDAPGSDCNRFQVWLWLDTDGEKRYTKDGITVKGASYAVIYQTCDTSFISWNCMPRKNPALECERLMLLARMDGYEKVLQMHLDDYQRLFGRVKMTLDTNVNSTLPTDQRIKLFADDMGDNDLVALYYNFGRYLLIASQREDSMPGNLQGVWNWRPRSDWWGSDYHLNINLQQNYWPCENSNLSECHMSLFKWLSWLCESGKKTAHDLHGCRGSCAYHISDIWAKTTPENGNPVWGYWPMGEAWLALDIFNHYEYTKDLDFLSEYFDLLKQNALFLYDWTYLDPETGYYVTSPSTSPENEYWHTEKDGTKHRVAVSKATTCDMTLVREVFNDFIRASKILGRDKELADKLEERIPQLFPFQIGEKGDLLEWYKDFEQTEIGHRHLSHFLSIYPGNLMNEFDTPEFFRAAEKSLEIRLDNGCGYAGHTCGCAIIYLARFRDNRRIGDFIKVLLGDVSMFPSMLDRLPGDKFQIDGNLAGTAALAEMLLHSNKNIIEILPCRPEFMKNGSVSGLRAKGAVTVNMEWKDGALTHAEFIPDFDGEYTFRHNGQIVTKTAKAGQKVSIFD